MCTVDFKEDGSFTQICNCKYGSDFCEEKETVIFQGKEIEF